jgi:phosphoribosylaminoimidazole synthetase
MSDEMTYRAAGVDIEAGYEAVRRIRTHARTTFRPGVLGDIGTFGGLFAVPVDRYREPVLVSGTDGVGTKLKIAFMTGRHDTVGIDVVAYCVNDILCQGAEPLFFLDYIGIGKLDPDVVERIVAGVAEGCRQAGCALIGGETAELPGLYAEGEYDLVGFAVGVVERERLIDGKRTRAGDIILGIASTGLQSSGYSLVRKVCFEKAGLKVEEYIPELGRTLAEELLQPTGIYAKALSALLQACDVRGIANISGGGLPENLPRALAPGLTAVVRRDSWPVPPVFPWLERLGGIDREEMYRTFNMGVGMAVILGEDEADKAREVLAQHGWESWPIGHVVQGEEGVRWA